MKAKTIFILSALLIVSCTSVAQNPAVSTVHSDSEITALIQNFRQARTRETSPTIVLAQRFQQDFPNARRGADWYTNNDLFKVEFEVGRRDFWAFYDQSGNLLLFKQEIRRSELPAVVRTAAQNALPNYRIDRDAYRIVKGTQTFYKIEMERLRSDDIILFVKSDGSIMEGIPVF